jgi:hypothetical protein
LKRAAGFSTLFLVFLFWYLILLGHKGKLSDALNIFPYEVIPLIPWLCFAGYCFWPNKEMFNGRGRLYVFKIFRSIVKTPFISVSFPVRYILVSKDPNFE